MCIMNRIILTFILALIFPSTLSAQSVYQAHTEVDLVTEAASIAPGAPFWVGLRMKMDPEWHVYWRNAGDSGLPPSIKWKLPEGFTAGEIQWPYPSRINLGPLTSFGYEGEVILWSRITPPPNLPSSKNLLIAADIDWLACKVDCIPGKAKLMMLLPVTARMQKNMDVSALVEKSRLLWPETDNLWWGFTAYDHPENFVLELWPPSPKLVARNVYFYPYSDRLIAHAKPQEFKLDQHGYALTIPKSNLITTPPAELKGILLQDEAWDPDGKYRAIEIRVPLEPSVRVQEGQLNSAENEIASAENRPRSSFPLMSDEAGIVPMGRNDITLLLSCLFAFIGGIILNFMPCVLPVLSLKIVGLVKSAQNRQQMINSGLLFTAGVIVSFWILAGLLIALQAAGHQLGWGFQFQSPVFVAAMAVILFILGYNLLGVFEIGTSLTGVGQSAPSTGYWGSFWSGVLATVVATPCTAPFMGTAISFALTQPPFVAFLVFTFLALGMASLYLLLCIFPGALRFVPKPGRWMIILKAIFGFVLFACVIWLAWVLGLQKGTAAVVVLAIGLGLIAFGLWLWGFHQRGKGGAAAVLFMWIFTAGGLVTAVGGPAAFLSSHPDPALAGEGSRSFASAQDDTSIAWQDFSSELLAQLRAEKKPVFIDFTAAWCLTCQVNDRLVFQNKKVVEAFRNSGIIALKADWTNHSEVITRALAGYGKNSIPVYVLYGNQREDAVFFPELVTVDLVIDFLNRHIKQGDI